MPLSVGARTVSAMSSADRMGLLTLLELGLVPYGPSHRLQQELVERRRTDQVGDLALVLEHTPVLTLGRRADPVHVLVSQEDLAQRGVEVYRVERGGDVTYHGPGQLVVYPILRLRDHGLGPSDYMHLLEKVIIATLADYGIEAGRRDKLIGVWVGDNKIAALGVRVKRGITMHGLALNVAPNMDHWSLIVPCGIREGGVTSMALELGTAPAVADVGRRLATHLAATLGVTPRPGDPAHLPWPEPTAAGAPVRP
jgi:lipoate-protein ligase B